MRCDLGGKVAVVTGGAGAIGRAIARRLADNGAVVVIADIDRAGAEAVASGLPGALAVRLDISDEASAAAAVAEIVERAGGVDILVNNAGVNTLAHRVTIEAFPREEWDRITGIDLDGLYLVSRAALVPMLAGGGGRIVNIASVVGLAAMRLQCAFVAAKAGVVHLTRAMALELGPRGVLTNAVAPGSVMTELTAKLFYGADGIVRRADRRVHGACAAGAAGAAGGDRRGGAVPGVAGGELRQRAGAGGRWRLDGGVYGMTLEGLTLAVEGETGPVLAGVRAALVAEGAVEAGGVPDLLVLGGPLVPGSGGAELLAVARRATEAMAERGSGRIVFLLPALAGLPVRRHGDWSVAAAAVLAGMRGLAMTFGPAVLVNAVGVGAVEEDGAIVAGDAAFLRHASVPRAGTIAEVAAAVVFFCDPLNSYTTGQMLAVDGGWMAGYGRNF